MPRSDPFGGAQNAPKPAVRCAKPIQLVQMPAADQTPRARSVQNVVPSAQNANTQCSAARIPTAGATGVPFRPAQVAVVDRARADAEETKTHVTNIMPNSCRSGRARRASYHKKDRPNAVRSKWTTKQTPCHRCRRRRSHRKHNASPAASFGQPKKRKSLGTPIPAERCSAPAEADRPSSPAAVSFGQPNKRRSSSACPSFSLPAEVPEAMHLEESQPF